jgi:cell division septation protein DedD
VRLGTEADGPGHAAVVGQPGSRAWLAPSFIALIVAALGAGASIALSSDGEVQDAIATATGGSLTVEETNPLLTAPEPTTTATKPATTTAPRPRPRPANPAFATWPRPNRGWTIVLISLPQRSGRAAAEAKADEARKRGLRRVGVLDSSRYASLHPGYYVVFTGIFDTQTEAVSALQRARAVFRSAYQREIVP